MNRRCKVILAWQRLADEDDDGETVYILMMARPLPYFGDNRHCPIFGEGFYQIAKTQLGLTILLKRMEMAATGGV
jgi:hypothetical protein